MVRRQSWNCVSGSLIAKAIWVTVSLLSFFHIVPVSFPPALFFDRLPTSVPASQARGPSSPALNIPLTWPCGSRQISGCSHFCQSSSIGCLSANKSWIPSINNIFSFGMTGVDKIRFNRVVSIASCAGLRAWSASRTRRQKTGWRAPHAHRGHSQNDTGDACIAARSQSRKPSPKRKTQKPHGWATFIKQPASQRANLGDVLCNSPRKLQTILIQWVGADGVEDRRERPKWPH